MPLEVLMMVLILLFWIQGPLDNLRLSILMNEALISDFHLTKVCLWLSSLLNDCF